MESDVRMFEGDLPYLEEMLREVRQSVEGLRDIALANGADPDANPTARLVAAGRGACNGIAEAIAEAKRRCAIVRVYVDTGPHDGEVPADVRESWEVLHSAHAHARQELLSMGAMF
jgi:hypothetical protein